MGVQQARRAETSELWIRQFTAAGPAETRKKMVEMAMLGGQSRNDLDSFNVINDDDDSKVTSGGNATTGFGVVVNGTWEGIGTECSLLLQEL
jgi:hypothetical protein